MPKANVPKMMSSMVSDLQSTAWAKGVKLVCDATSEIEAELDQPLIVACLTRLVSSLIEAAPYSASLSVVTSLELPEGQPLGRLRIQVSAPASLGSAAQQAAATATLALTGCGAEVEHRGDEDVWTFTLSVPNARAAMTLASGLTAVVVDDDVDTQEFLAEILRARGFRVISVNDGFDALVVIERHRPDVVLTDILMPNMSGLDLVARIKRFRADLPVVVFSGYRDALAKHVAGLPDKILPKPMARADVLKAIDEVLAK